MKIIRASDSYKGLKYKKLRGFITLKAECFAGT